MGPVAGTNATGFPVKHIRTSQGSSIYRQPRSYPVRRKETEGQRLGRLSHQANLDSQRKAYPYNPLLTLYSES